LKPELSILIVNWNSKDHLRRCLETVCSTCRDIPLQIIVVDGGSFDGCNEMLAAEFPEVEFVQSKENIGFGRSNNLGFEHVTSEALLLLNPDAELKPNAVRLLLEQLRSTPEMGIIGARLLNSDGSLQTSCVQSLPTPLNQSLNSEFLRRLFPRSKLWGVTALESKEKPQQVEAVSGACMMLRSETFRRLGGFDPRYFMYGEDMDLCHRTALSGLKIFYLPTAEIVHHGGGSSVGKFSRLSAVFMRESVGMFIRTHQGILAAVLYRLFMAVSSMIRLVLLVPVCALSQASKKSARFDSIRKWLAILRWSAGLERSPKCA
jgi:GT2 family glycosyltransferase